MIFLSAAPQVHNRNVDKFIGGIVRAIVLGRINNMAKAFIIIVIVLILAALIASKLGILSFYSYKVR